MFSDGWTGYNGIQTDQLVKLHRRCNHSVEWVNFKNPEQVNLNEPNLIEKLNLSNKTKEYIHIQNIEA